MSVKFGTYTPRPKKSEQTIISRGIFFDGTLNNKTNTEGRLAYENQRKGKKISASDEEKAIAYTQYGIDDEKSSYQNEYSNVARIWECYNDQQSVYVEGMGTTDKGEDDSLGYAMGTGRTGIPALVRKGCLLLSDKFTRGQVIPVLQLDVFGFSRGSAAARHFVAEISKPEIKGSKPAPAYGYLGECLQKKGVKVNKLEIRFLGIYDTVSSFEPRAQSVVSKEALYHNFGNDVAELNLNNITKAKRVLHLTAENEHRENFSLTHTHVGIEKPLPGAHSDVGGGYTSGTEKVGVILKDSIYIVEEEKERLVREGWFTDDELKISLFGPNHELSGRRKLKHTYSYVPLHIMVDYAIEYYTELGIGEKSNPISKNKLLEKYSISNDKLLVRIHKKLWNYVFHNGKPYTFKWFKEVHTKYKNAKQNTSLFAAYQEEMQDQNDLRALRHGYLHWSANYEGIGMDPTPNRKRTTY